MKDIDDLLMPRGRDRYRHAHGPKVQEAFNDLESIVAHEPGDPGPAYDIIERTERVIAVLKGRAK